MAKKDGSIMENRIPNFLVAYNYFSIEHIHKKIVSESETRGT